MKTKGDPRHQRRVKAIQIIYSLKFNPNQKLDTEPDIEFFIHNLQSKEIEINKLIDKYTKTFSSEKMSPLDLSILELGIYELKFAEIKEPVKVIIDECIEIAKEFGTTNSPKFVNGVLGKIINDSKIQ